MTKNLLTLGILTLAGLASGMPPAPGLLERLEREGRLQALSTLHTDARTAGVNASFQMSVDDLQRDGSDEVTYHVICILVDFADNQADTVNASREHFEEMLFSVGEYQTGSMRDWYLENSFDQVIITGDVAGWYRMPRDYAYYVNGQQGFGQYPANAQGLARDALRAADADVDYNDYDNNNNRVAEGLFIVHAGMGAEQTGSDDMIWSHAWGVPRDLRLDGVAFQSYAMEPENGRVGVFGHELAHSLFGLPDLYDTQYQSAGVGSWSMMAGGSWGGGGDRPVHFDAWCKQRIGLIDPFPIIENRLEFIMDPVELNEDILIVWRPNDLQNEYFLIENRQQVGFDASLPGEGLLIWHCDDNARNNNHPWWPGQGNEHNIVALEQADGEYALEHNGNSGDGGDPFPGETWNTLFADETSPDSKDYAGRSTDVSVANIESIENDRVRFDIYVDNLPQPVVPNLFLLERIPEAHVIPDPDVPADSTDEVTLVIRYLNRMGAGPHGHSGELPEDWWNYNVIVYLESWRDSDSLAGGLSEYEQFQLTLFLENGGKLLLVGPDVAANMQRDSLLWPYCHAVFYGDGSPRETGNIRTLTGNPESRIAGENFVYRQRGINDHFTDIVEPGDGAQALFTDQTRTTRGMMYTGNYGERVILQPFLFGGMIDWGGSKAELLLKYFEYFRFEVADVENEPIPLIPTEMRLTDLFPNPFNNMLQIGWEAAPTGTWINIFDQNGRTIGRLNLDAGSGFQNWHPEGLPPGQYFLQPGIPGSQTRRVTLLR